MKVSIFNKKTRELIMAYNINLGDFDKSLTEVDFKNQALENAVEDGLIDEKYCGDLESCIFEIN